MALDQATHKSILMSVLRDIFSDFEIAPYLGFKGGTAAMLFYDLPRFSVDLDFDLLHEGRSDEVFEHLKHILANYGVVKEARRKRFGFLFLLSYHNKQEGAHNVKVEVNIKNFGSRYEIKRYLGIAMNVMVEQDMVAHKMVALYERMGKANRDVFDVWYFLKNHASINIKIIEQRTGMSYSDFLKACIKGLEGLDKKQSLSGLGQLLTEQQKVWCKVHLIPDIVFLLRLALNSEESISNRSRT